MKRKGFTLVELLAVIAILAILVIIALPNVMGMFNNAKENSFKTEVKEVYKVAQQTWMQDSMFKNDENFDTYLNDPDSQIYYALKYQNSEVINWFTITKYGQYWETYDGFGRSLTDWDYQPPSSFMNEQIKDSSQGCYTPGWG